MDVDVGREVVKNQNQKMGQAGRGAGQRGGCEDRRPFRRLALVFGEFGPVIMGGCWLLG